MRSDCVRAAAPLALLLAGVLLATPTSAPAAPPEVAPVLGPSVGDAERLINEGNRLYNRKQYKQAAVMYLQANRANPSHPGTYLSLARARLAANDVAPACAAYRAFLRFAPEGPDRGRAERELQLCERRLRANRQQEQSPEAFAARKSEFFAAMERESYLGEDGAAAILRATVEEGHLSHELGEMASALHAALVATAEAAHEEALQVRNLPAARLEAGAEAFAWAAAIGSGVDQAVAKTAFLIGRAELARASDKQRSLRTAEGDGHAAVAAEIVSLFTEATRLLAQAIEADPERDEYKFYRAVALYRQGDRSGARAALQRDLPDDPRTQVLSAVSMLRSSPELAVSEIEQVLFRHRFPDARR